MRIRRGVRLKDVTSLSLKYIADNFGKMISRTNQNDNTMHIYNAYDNIVNKTMVFISHYFYWHLIKVSTTNSKLRNVNILTMRQNSIVNNIYWTLLS